MLQSEGFPRLRDPARLSAVRSALRFDSAALSAFDRLARLAARSLRAPVAQVNFISEDQQISVSSVGPGSWDGPQTTPSDLSYCKHAVETGQPFLVRDARKHPLVQDNPATSESGIVAYAAVPLTVAEDVVVGTLCVVDFAPREWSEEELELLLSLADFAITEVQRRGHTDSERLHLASLLESTQDAMIGVDLEETIQSWSRGAEHMFLYAADDVIGHPGAMLIPPERLPEVVEVREAIRRGETTPRFETEYLRRDGSRVPVSVVVTPVRDLADRIVGATALVRDIASRVAAQRALQDSEARLRLLIEHGTEMITVLAVDGTIRYESPATERVFGFTPEERLGRDACAFINPADVPRVQDAFAYVIEDAVPRSLEFRMRTRSGGERLLAATAISLLHERAVAGVVVNSTDVTELRRGEERLRQVQKMEAMGRLAGGIAHDFNNILMVIKGLSGVTLMDLPEESPVREDVLEIDRAADRAANLTRQLLAFSRQQVLQPQLLDLNELVSDMEKMLRRTLGGDVEFVSVLDPAVGRVEADPGQIEQILMNLAVNARDAMADGGTLIMETQNTELGSDSAEQISPTMLPGPYVMLAVSDTGAGMPKEVQERVFEPFFTTKEPGKGTGLGLATVYGIVKQSGGYIWIYSEEERGTTVKVYLPRAGGLEREPQPPFRHSEGPAPRRATILLAEDEPVVRSIARRLLERSGHEVIEASNGQEALRLAEAHRGEIDLLITDIRMPLMGGVELAERITARWPAIRLLYTSGYTDEANIHHGLQEGSVVFLQKPYDRSAVIQRESGAGSRRFGARGRS